MNTYLVHGKEWQKHKYLYKDGNRYVYKETNDPAEAEAARQKLNNDSSSYGRIANRNYGPSVLNNPSGSYSDREAAKDTLKLAAMDGFTYRKSDFGNTTNLEAADFVNSKGQHPTAEQLKEYQDNYDKMKKYYSNQETHRLIAESNAKAEEKAKEEQNAANNAKLAAALSFLRKRGNAISVAGGLTSRR